MINVKDINVNEACIGVIKSKGYISNDHLLKLNDENYNFILKNLKKAFKSNKLRLANVMDNQKLYMFIKNYFDNKSTMISICDKITSHIFNTMKVSNDIDVDIAEIMVVNLSTELTDMIAVLVFEFKEQFANKVKEKNNKKYIDIISERKFINRLKKAFFIPRYNDKFDLLVLNPKTDSFLAESFNENFINYVDFNSNSDSTLEIMKLAEKSIVSAEIEDISVSEDIRNNIRSELKENSSIYVEELIDNVSDDENFKEEFKELVSKENIKDFKIDKEVLEKKLNNLVFILDSGIEIKLTDEIYNNPCIFKMDKKSDGSCDIIIKNIRNIFQK